MAKTSDAKKTKAELVEELVNLRQQVAELQAEMGRLKETPVQEVMWLNTLLNSSPDYIFFKDRESRFLVSNPAHVQKLLGISDPRKVVGKTDFDLYPGEEENVQRFYDEEQEVMETGRPVIAREWTVPSPITGEMVWLSEHKIPMRDESGNIVGLVAIGRDVTARKVAEEKLRRRAIHLQAVAEVAREATAILDVQQLLDRVAHLVSEGFDFYHTGVFLLDELGQRAVLRAASSEGGRRMLERGHQLPVGEIGIVGYVAATNAPRIALDVGDDAVFFNNPDLPKTRSEMALPLSVRGKVIGVLDVQSTEPAAFTEEDVAVLRVLVDQLAVAIENARLVQHAEEQLRELSLLSSEFTAETWSRLSVADQPLGYVYDRVDVVPTDTTPSSAHDLVVESDKVVELDASDESGAVLAVPLRVRGQVIGSLGVEMGDERSWSAEEMTLIEAVGEQVAQAIDSARLFAEAQKTALSMESLYQTSRAISSSLEEEAMVRAVLEAVYRTLVCEYVFLYIVDEGTRTIGLSHGIWQGEFDVYPEWLAMDLHSLNDPSITADVYRTGHTEIIKEWDDRFDREIWERYDHARFLRIFMPINLRERVIGIVEVAYDKRQRDHVGEDEVQMLAAFMDQAAVALENVRLFDQVQRRAQREHRIYEITNRLRRSPDISSILQTAVDELGRALQVDRAMVHLRVRPSQERDRIREMARAGEQE
jgi:PAS domain S-box-containing protein